jgi:glycosyltransferase involved in cell wall biosynthesis
MMVQPLVSVVCPAYNCARFIQSALESVFAQIYRPIEIIVVDDGSTDTTPELIQRYREIHYLKQENRGPSAARNLGVRAAHGEYIAFLDLDDLWTPKKLSEQIARLESLPDAGLSFSDMRLFSAAGNDDLTMFQKYRLTKEFFGDDRYVDHAVTKLVSRNFIPTSSVVVRKTVLTQSGGFDERFRKAEDWDLWLRIGLRYPIIYSSIPLVLKRVHDVNVSRDSEGMNVAALKVLEKFRREYQRPLDSLGVDITGVLRDAYRNLGYFYLRQMSLTEARNALSASLALGFHGRALVYFLSTFLGRSLVGTLVRARG